MGDHPVGSPSPDGTEVECEIGKGGIEQFTTWNHDGVYTESPSGQVAEQFPHEAFRPVALHRAADLAGCDDPEPCGTPAVWQHEKREEPPMEAGAALEHHVELGAAPDALRFREAAIRC
jgi:hypothetical protein